MMIHKPIFLRNLSLNFKNKTCFEDFTTTIYSGDRIVIIGRNGSGKSSLLNILRGKISPSSGELTIPDDICTGYIEQTINDFSDLSGGQRFNKKLSQVLTKYPNLLLLDEPTNHLDKDNRKSLNNMLIRYPGSLIIVSHDIELLRSCIDTVWHIDNNKIYEFTGSYDDYIRQIKHNRMSVEKELISLKCEKKDAHNNLMKEQKRAAKSKSKGQKSISQRKWPTVVSNAKANKAAQTSGKKKSAIDKKKQQLINQLSEITLPDIILPKFSLTTENISAKNILSINKADVGYVHGKPLLKNLSLSLGGRERIAIYGKNGSGKSTLLKAILEYDEVITTGNWSLPERKYIGYIDQHYSNLNPEISIFDHVRKTRPDWNESETRSYLNDFLFRKNEEVFKLAQYLSGGEKARLSLCLISANLPKILVLDEITNNIDIETKEHLIQILKHYPGSMIIVSHEEYFLNSIGIYQKYTVKNGELLK